MAVSALFGEGFSWRMVYYSGVLVLFPVTFYFILIRRFRQNPGILFCMRRSWGNVRAVDYGNCERLLRNKMGDGLRKYFSDRNIRAVL